MEVLANSSQAFAEAEAQRRQEAEALRDTGAVLNSTLDPEVVLDHILANVGCIAPYVVADILLIEAGVAHVARSWNYAKQAPEETIQTFHFFVADTPNLRHMVESGQPQIKQLAQKKGALILFGDEASFAQ